MSRAKAIRHWAEWNRTGPVHYRDSRLCLIFNLCFPGAGWRRALWTKRCCTSCCDILNSFVVCPISRAIVTFWEGEEPSEKQVFGFFSSSRSDKCLLWKQTLIQTVTTYINKSVAVMWPQLATSSYRLLHCLCQQKDKDLARSNIFLRSFS